MNTQQEIIENNKLIAEFMGWKERTDPTERWFLYHTSWDWLMPVVEKIESVKAWHVEISTDSCTIHNGLLKKPVFETYTPTKIEATHEAVVEFIKWHNKQNMSNESCDGETK